MVPIYLFMNLDYYVRMERRVSSGASAPSRRTEKGKKATAGESLPIEILSVQRILFLGPWVKPFE